MPVEMRSSNYTALCITNVNRQNMATTKTVGRVKVEALRERLLEINLRAEITALQQIYGQEAAYESRQRICIITDKLCHSAIHLYEEYEFKHIPGQSSLYQRGDYLTDNVCK